MAKHFTRENFIKLIKLLFPNKKSLDKIKESIAGTLMLNGKEIAEVKTLNTDAWFTGNALNIDAPGNNYLDDELLLPTKFLEVVYPVGSIYMNVNDIDPNKIFGGEWIRWGNGRMPIGINEDDNSFKVSEIEGGEKTHVLTTAEMPAHSHSCIARMTGWGNSASNPSGAYVWKSHSNFFMNPDSSAWTGQTFTPAIGYTNTVGNTAAHNNMPPYITCYMWKRIG